MSEHKAPGDATSRRAVATVNGATISVGDIEAVVRRSAQAPKKVLALLVAERLLTEEAYKRGFDADSEVVQVGKQAAVQELLIERVERQTRVDGADLEAAYQRELSRFQQPERRGSVHVLAKLNPGADAKTQLAAEQLAREAIAAFRKEGDSEQLLERFRRRSSMALGVMTERLPPMGREDAIETPYKEALFSLPTLGVVQEPIRTSYGWHAIYLTEIQPAQMRGLTEVAELLRPQVQQEKRAAQVKTLIERARRSAKIVPHASAIQWLMNADLSAVFQQ
jgi:peptidyl-prolyl cis-trans isomerase C